MQPKLFIGILSFLGIAFFCSCGNDDKPQTNKIPISRLDSGKFLHANPYKQIDISPLDIAYFPDSFPIFKMKPGYVEQPVMRIMYSRPHKKGRLIFGDESSAICPYGKPWRLGANEASEIEFYRNVSISGKNVSKGRYVIYCVPHIDKWDIILNSNLFSWGLHIDSTKDVFKTEIPVMQQNPTLEDFTMVFQQSPTGANLLMAWDSVKAILPIDFAK